MNNKKREKDVVMKHTADQLHKYLLYLVQFLLFTCITFTFYLVAGKRASVALKVKVIQVKNNNKNEIKLSQIKLKKFLWDRSV